MQNKLKEILNTKIDAINKNIDNLNYLNGELDKNNEDLTYIKELISLFKNNEILNFDKISKDEFDKVLLMVDPSVSNVFKSKTCSYEGIIYIIEGIRKSISLELTEEQNSAILSFIEGMRIKSFNLQDIIANLNDSKNNLPETNMDVLSNDLEKYRSIVSNLDENLYLTEIDDIEIALDFSEISIEEKADIYEYLLKYNAEIYSKNEKVIEKEKIEDETVELPEFHYEPIDLNLDVTNSNMDLNNSEFDIDDSKEVDKELNYEENDAPTEEKMPTLEDIIFNLDQMNKDYGLNNENDDINEINNYLNDNHDISSLEKNDEMLFNDKPYEEPVSVPIEIEKKDEEIESSKENHELNTVELEDIIKKIDAKLKEMDNDEEKNNESLSVDENKFNDDKIYDSSYNNSNLSIETNQNVDYSDVLNKYLISNVSISGKNVEEIDSILGILNDNKLLDDLKNNKELLSEILNKSSLKRFEEISTIINNDLLVKKNEYEYVFEIMIKTIPIIFVNDDAFESFKANLEFFKEHKLNIINLFDNYRELLIMNNDTLKSNYKDAEMYGVEINNENVKYYLYNSHLLENIDYYIEAIGYEKGFLGKEEKFDGIEYIKKNPYKLNEINRNTLMKLRYASENNNKIYGNKPGILSGEISNPKVDVITLSDDYKNTYFNGIYSFIDRSEWEKIKQEIDNLKEFDLTMDGNINKLDSSYKLSELRYKIGDILISRIKTIRIYNFLKNKNMSLKNALLVAITYNTVLKLTEYDEIKTVVEAIVEGGN